MEFLNTTQFIVLFVTAITATFYFYKYKHTSLKWFLVLFWYTAINDIVAFQYWNYFQKTNNVFYNIFFLVHFSIILWVIYSNITFQKRKKWSKYLLIIFWGSFVINCIFRNPLIHYLDASYTVGTILTVISILFYFIDLMLSSEVIKIKRDLLLWINLGFLLFNISYPVILATQNLYGLKTTSLASNLFVIQLIISIASYLTIAFGFYWGEKITSSLPSIKNSGELS